jgi:hypothetical protein
VSRQQSRRNDGSRWIIVLKGRFPWGDEDVRPQPPRAVTLFFAASPTGLTGGNRSLIASPTPRPPPFAPGQLVWPERKFAGWHPSKPAKLGFLPVKPAGERRETGEGIGEAVSSLQTFRPAGQARRGGRADARRIKLISWPLIFQKGKRRRQPPRKPTFARLAFGRDFSMI